MFNFNEFQTKLTKIKNHLDKELATLRTGRATVTLLDPVKVEAYGTYMKINEVASVTAPDATLLVVEPWDKSLLEAIEKAIASAGLNLNPVVQDNLIRIAVPPLTEEKRKEMVKLLHQKIESARIMLRNLRNEAKKQIEDQKDEAGVSEDDVKADLEELEKHVKEALDEFEAVASAKESELMQV